MADSDITLEVLRDIRESIRSLDRTVATRMDATNERIDETNARLNALTQSGN